jgi:hypothetical protein
VSIASRENAMRKTIILTLFLVSTLYSGVCFAIGYTVFVRLQVQPIYNQVGDIQILNPGESPVYPATFRTVVCRPANFSIYSTSETNRKEVWEDYEGAATADEIQTACGPLWNRSNPSTAQ